MRCSCRLPYFRRLRLRIEQVQQATSNVDTWAILKSIHVCRYHVLFWGKGWRTHRIHGTGFHVGKYTRPMDPMGKVVSAGHQASRFRSFLCGRGLCQCHFHRNRGTSDMTGKHGAWRTLKKVALYVVLMALRFQNVWNNYMCHKGERKMFPAILQSCIHRLYVGNMRHWNMYSDATSQ